MNEHGFSSGTKRRSSRTIFKEIGPPIYKFKTVLDVLYALIDAIRVHQRMVQQAGVLHGNVSINSIIFGGVVPGADSEEGRRVSLVDFDMSISHDCSDAPLSDEHHRTGTRMFQSLNVLKAWRPHGYLDDLESFLYVLLYLIFAFPTPGATPTAQVQRELPKELQDWNADSLREAFKSKSTFMTYGASDLPVPPMWGPHISALIDDLCHHFQPIRAMSSRMQHRNLPKAQRDKLEASFEKKYFDDVDEQYDEVVGYIESAIESILAEQDSANDSEQSTLSDSLSHSRPSKGRREEGI
ncbi:other/FunK1 protein kinase [Coprinopsis cinerea okayama7|uniref:Other/FunK1 protein kinase n=1 Tax=Coprinopsis cinerea (strain Okayama-7 / 130 / ATCC MYA-4618 / FGSC 9003) TaxID=240176 RepID=A8PE83_COPC7|nr:other/FunK1 protein kinase [Coprinopsis cinerea okayama7\|eukprot:XP_001840744.1 other/FunK1 protein kinase [Coprinopsis cinerea okayama7\